MQLPAGCEAACAAGQVGLPQLMHALCCCHAPSAQPAAVLQALAACGHDISAALASYQAGRHAEVLALHELDLSIRARLGSDGALHPLALANGFHAVRAVPALLLAGARCWVPGAAGLSLSSRARLGSDGVLHQLELASSLQLHCCFAPGPDCA